MAKLDGTYVERKKKTDENAKSKKAKQQAAAASGSGHVPMQTGNQYLKLAVKRTRQGNMAHVFTLTIKTARNSLMGTFILFVYM